MAAVSVRAVGTSRSILAGVCRRRHGAVVCAVTHRATVAAAHQPSPCGANHRSRPGTVHAAPRRYASAAAGPTTMPRRVPRILVVDGYSRDGRNGLEAGGASLAGALYERMLNTAAANVCVSRDAHGARVPRITGSLGAVDTAIIYPADDGVVLPSAADLARDFDAVAWTGCSLTVYSGEERVQRQIEFCRSVAAAGLPSFGSCWALQIAAVASGGVAAANPKGREFGVSRKLALTPDGRGHPMFHGKRAVFEAFTSHEDEVTHVPANAVVLASNAHSAVQALVATVGGAEFWAVQYHPEYDLAEVAALARCRTQKLKALGMFRDDAGAAAWIADLEALHHDPAGNRDIAWRYGIDADLTDPDVRCAEVRNWLRYQVLPTL